MIRHFFRFYSQPLYGRKNACEAADISEFSKKLCSLSGTFKLPCKGEAAVILNFQPFLPCQRKKSARPFHQLWEAVPLWEVFWNGNDQDF